MSKPDAKRRYRRRRAMRIADRALRFRLLAKIARRTPPAETVSFYKGMSRAQFDELRDQIPLTVFYDETQRRVANAYGWLVCHYCDQAFPPETVTRIGVGSYMCGACIPF